MEKFDPTDDKYKKVEDLPEPMREDDFMPPSVQDLFQSDSAMNTIGPNVSFEAEAGGGFVRKSAARGYNNALRRAEIDLSNKETKESDEKGYMEKMYSKVRKFLGRSEDDGGDNNEWRLNIIRQAATDMIHQEAFGGLPVDALVESESLLLRDALIMEEWEKMRELLPNKGDKIFCIKDRACGGETFRGVIGGQTINIHDCFHSPSYRIDDHNVTAETGVRLLQKIRPCAISVDNVLIKYRDFRKKLRERLLLERGSEIDMSLREILGRREWEEKQKNKNKEQGEYEKEAENQIINCFKNDKET